MVSLHSTVEALHLADVLLLFYARIGIMSFIFAIEAHHLANVFLGEVVRAALKFLLLPTATSDVTTIFLPFHWCDLGHHVLILLPLILNHIG